MSIDPCPECRGLDDFDRFALLGLGRTGGNGQGVFGVISGNVSRSQGVEDWVGKKGCAGGTVPHGGGGP